MRAPLPLLLLALLLGGAPLAAAQQLTIPVTGAFEDVYVVAGRAVDSRGEPVAGAQLTVELAQEGVRAAPLKATTSCKGDFITSFSLKAPTAQGRVSVTVHARDGGTDGRATGSFDPFFRRTDLVVQLKEPWAYRCAPKDDVWPVAVSVTGRVVNRTEPYEKAGVTYEARPYPGPLRLRYVDGNGTLHCPPPGANAPPGTCDFLAIDERGDFRYTFTFPAPVDANGTVTVLVGETPHSLKVDPLTRQAVLLIEATGRGPPAPPAPAPGPGPLLVALAAAAAALLARRALRR